MVDSRYGKPKGAVAKGTTRRTSVSSVTRLGPCSICGEQAIKPGFGGKCGPCRTEFNEFTEMIAANNNSDSWFKMYRDLRHRIEALEDALEIKRITEKYQ